MDARAGERWQVGPRDLRIVALLAGAKLLVHLVTAGRYGYFRDELYFLDCGRHLDWGYVDCAPLIAIKTGRHMGVSRQIQPPMPWQVYRNASVEDLKSIYAYLRTIPPVKNLVPDYQPPAPPASVNASR